MLGKLIKHDFKSLARLLLPVNLVIFGATVLASLSLTLILRRDVETPGLLGEILDVIFGLVVAFAVFAIIAAFFMVPIVIFYRFYKSCIDSEGYLTFTLPVSSDKILWSKFLTAVFWVLISLVVGALCLYIFLVFGTAERGLVNYEFLHGFSEAIDELGISLGKITPKLGWTIAEAVVMILVTSFANILQIFLALIIGGAVAQRHKLLAGIGFYFAINMVMGFISSVVMIFVTRAAGKVDSVSISGNMPSAEIQNEAAAALQYLLLPSLIEGLIMCVAFFLASCWLMKNKLNLA